MPIIKSAKKRVRVTNRATERNRGSKNNLKDALKSFVASVKGGKSSAAEHAAAQSEIDKAVKKGLIHKNKAARTKAKLARDMKASGSKPEKSTKAKVAVAKKAPAKAAATKTAPKTATKTAKPAVKKAVAKKAPAKK
jgi:small subunit ribosomal protein S20